MSQTFVEGWTERIRTQLLTDGTPFNLTDYDLPPANAELVLGTTSGERAHPAGKWGIDTAAAGIVYFDPHPGDLLVIHSPYSVRWKVTDSFGKAAFFPNDIAEEWIIRPPTKIR
jgi:hypothetical protein